MEEFYTMGVGEFTMEDINKMISLRSDFKNNK
jgi:hypothetical protein